MADDVSKAATQAFGVIPNAYFDLIARVMPGLLLLFGLNRTLIFNPITTVLEVFAPFGELRGSTTAWLLVMVTTAYILGHAMSPLVRFFEEGPDHLFREAHQSRSGEPGADRWVNLLRRLPVPPGWRAEMMSPVARTNVQEEYNALRFQNPSLSGLAVRIRAEYTMYGGFAVAVMISLVLASLHFLHSVYLHHGLLEAAKDVPRAKWIYVVLGFVAVPLMLYRDLHTYGRYSKTVAQLRRAIEKTSTGGVSSLAG